jgi:hypothetical protein
MDNLLSIKHAVVCQLYFMTIVGFAKSRLLRLVLNSMSSDS